MSAGFSSKPMMNHKKRSKKITATSRVRMSLRDTMRLGAWSRSRPQRLAPTAPWRDSCAVQRVLCPQICHTLTRACVRRKTSRVETRSESYLSHT